MGTITKDDRCLIKGLRFEEKMAGEDKRLIKEFPNNTVNTTTSLEYMLLSITVAFVVAEC